MIFCLFLYYSPFTTEKNLFLPPPPPQPPLKFLTTDIFYTTATPEAWPAKLFAWKTFNFDDNHITLKSFAGDLYIGNTIVLYSRTLQILDYGDDFTRNNCSTSSESTFVMVKPGGVQQIGNILSNIQNSGFTLARAKMIQMGRHQAEQFCRKYQISPSFNELGR